VVRERLMAILCSAVLVMATGCGNSARPSDEAIVTAIQGKMLSEPAIKASTISVSAKDGVITLSGQLPNEAARETVEKIASEAVGVSKVVDRTTVAARPAAMETVPAETPVAPAGPVVTAKPRSAPAAKPASGPAAVPANKREPAPSAPAQEQQQTDESRRRVISTDVIPPPAAESGPIADPGPIVIAGSPAAVEPSAPAASPTVPKAQPVIVRIPEGAVVSVRTIDAIDSSVHRTGQSFRGSLDAPIAVNDKVSVPKDSGVTLKLISAESAGHISGRSELTVSLDSFTFQGKKYLVATSDVQQKGASRGKKSAAVIGGGAVLGAVIGGIAGGSKGAVIGAAAGGGAGTAVQAVTKGEQVKIPAETKLDFTLHAPVEVSYLPGNSATEPSAEGTTTPQSDQAKPTNGASNGPVMKRAPGSESPQDTSANGQGQPPQL
jgi:BON domain